MPLQAGLKSKKTKLGHSILMDGNGIRDARAARRGADQNQIAMSSRNPQTPIIKSPKPLNPQTPKPLEPYRSL